MIRTVESFIEERGMIPRGAHVLAGVSGGPDSMALLDILARLREPLGFVLSCATVDHGLRAGTDREAALVESEAAGRGVHWSLLECDAAGEAARRGSGIEEAARDLRLGLLAAEARRLGASRVALGHTLDDQAETVLMRLARGTGVRGMGGIPAVRDGLLIRPLLRIDRARILRHLARARVPWIEDPTNMDRRFMRNRIRLDVLPALDACQRGVAGRLASLADEAQETVALLDTIVEEAARRIAGPLEGPIVLDRRAVASLDPGLRSLVMREVLVSAKGDARGIGRRHVEALVALSGSGAGSASVDLTGGIRASRTYDRIVVTRKPADGSGGVAIGPAEAAEVSVTGPGRWVLRDVEIAITARPGQAPDAFPLDLRARQDGDRLAGRRKSLKELLIDCKVPRLVRDHVPLLARGRDVVWAGGLWVAGGCPVDVVIAASRGSCFVAWFEGRSRAR